MGKVIDGGAPKGKKKDNALLGAAKKIGGGALELVGAPQQIAFGLGTALGNAAGGDFTTAGAGLKHALAETASVGQARGNWDPATALGHMEDGKMVPKKLGYGLNTGLSIVADPLLFTGFGKGAEARKGISVLADTLNMDKKAVSAALKTGALDLSKGGATRTQLVQDLVAGGSKAKQAEKIAKLTARRGAGGMTVFVPGTEIAHTVQSADKIAAPVRAGIDALKATKTGGKVADVLGEAFNPIHSLTKALNGDSETAQTIHRLAGYRQTKAAAASDDLMAELVNAAEQAGHLTSADDVKMLTAFESGMNEVAALAQAEPRLAPMLDVITRARAMNDSSQVKRGLLDALHKSDTYMQRLMTSEAADVAKGGTHKAQQLLAGDVAGSVEGALKQAAARGRTIFPKMPAELVNELHQAVHSGVPLAQLLTHPPYSKFVASTDPAVLQTMIKDFEGLSRELGPEAKFYQESAIASVLNRTKSAQRAVQAHDFVDDLTALPPPHGSGMPSLVMDAQQIQALKAAGQDLPSDWTVFELPHMGEFAAPHSLSEEIKKVAGLATDENLVSDMGKFMQNWQKFWKTHATTGILGALPFAMRNGRSNAYLMVTDGMSFPEVLKYMGEARKLEDKVRKIVGTTRISGKFVGEHAAEVTGKGLDDVLRQHLTAHEYEVWQAMRKEGITTKGLIDVDFSEDVMDKAHKLTGGKREVKGGKIGKAVAPVLSPKGGMATVGRGLNQAVETNARMASFLYNLDKYGNIHEAALQTKKVLFDYDELTVFEKKVLKTYIPFYTFMRKNLPRQLETLVENPMRVAMPEKISQAQAGGLSEDAPDYQMSGGSRGVNPLVPLFGGGISTPDRPLHAATDLFKPLILAGQGEGKAAAREAVNIPGGPQLGLLQDLTSIGTGKDAFTGGNVQPGIGPAAQRLLLGQLPSAGRLPRVEVGGVSPTRAVTGKSAKPTADEILKLLTGLRVDRERK